MLTNAQTEYYRSYKKHSAGDVWLDRLDWGLEYPKPECEVQSMASRLSWRSHKNREYQEDVVGNIVVTSSAQYCITIP